MNEIWKDIDGYEGLYQVSNLGRVKSLNYNHTRKEKILKFGKISKNRDYLQVNLCKNGKVKRHLVHILVAQAFIPNPKNLPQVNHKDEDKTNNCVDNLEWISRKENCNYGTRNLRISEKLTNGICSKKIYQYSLDGTFISEWPSAHEIERQTSFASSSIYKVCNGKHKHKSAYGFVWRYK